MTIPKGFHTAAQREERLDRAQLVDLIEAISVEVFVDHANKLWINVDGKCLLCIGSCDKIVLDAPFVQKTIRKAKT